MENGIVIETVKKHLTKKIDERTLKELANFKINWLKKSEGHMLFLGGNLFGTDEIIFSDTDQRIFFDIVGIDNAKELKADINKIDVLFIGKEDKDADERDKDFVVATDPFNITILYLCHVFSNMYEKNKNKKETAIDLIYFIFAVKIFGSKYYKWFRLFRLENDIAKAVYEKLSDKYLIKRLNNWQSVIAHLGKKLYSTEKSGFDSRVKTMYPLDVVYIIQDIEGSINSLCRKIYDTTLEVKNSGQRIRTVSAIDTSGDENNLREVIDSPLSYSTYMKNIVGSENSFIDFAVVDVIISLFPKIKDKVFKQILQIISHNAFINPDINNYFIEKPIVLSMEYLGANKHRDYLDSIEKIILALKNYWSSSGIKEKEAVEAKDKIKDFLKDNTTYRTNHILSNIVLAIILYVFLKSIKKRD